jgi:hypothetical protein
MKDKNSGKKRAKALTGRNEELYKAMVELRRSSAAMPHDTQKPKGGRAGALRDAIKNSRDEND